MKLHSPLPRRRAALWALSLGLGLCLALGWGRTQLRTGAALCADTLRLQSFFRNFALYNRSSLNGIQNRETKI